METTKSPKSVERPAIDLAITGDELMLSGRFTDWESRVSMGPDLDQLFVRLAIDATSVGNTVGSAPESAASDGASDEQPVLFSFHGRQASLVSSGVYQVTGEFIGPTVTRELQVQLETPVAHSAMLVLSFDARKSDFGRDWTKLLSNVVPFGARADGSPAYARAWMTLPDLAAA